MTVEEYRQRMIDAFHNVDCDELIALVVLPTEKEFEHLEWLLEKHYKTKPKTGHWIYKQYGGYPEQGNYHCSECDNIDNRTPAYCPHCGCCMFEPQDKGEKA